MLSNHFQLQVKVSFLIVGHTHEDIDPVFSRIKTFLVKNTLLTLAGKYLHLYVYAHVYLVFRHLLREDPFIDFVRRNVS